MTTETLEGAQPEEELVTPEPTKVAPELESFSKTEDKQPSEPRGLTDERLESLLGAVKALDEKVEGFSRQAQSAKDRAISKTAADLAEVKARLDSFGGDWNAMAQAEEARGLYERVAALEKGISKPSVSSPEAWQKEWDAEHRKILDAAKERGVELTKEEFNQVMFNNGLPYASKGDAYASLNRALLAKAIGDKTPVSVVSAEGGETPRLPEPKAQKTFRGKLDAAKATNDQVAVRKILDEQWEALDRQTKLAAAKRAASEAGVELKESE